MGGIMNKDTYKALKADIHPDIFFTLNTDIKSIQPGLAANTILAKGLLTIAGVTNPVIMQVNILIPEKGRLYFKGSQILKLSDYGITPPSALLGAIKTGNEITINFKTNFTADK
jgi:polyisoprenoid-binding protein YceI